MIMNAMRGKGDPLSKPADFLPWLKDTEDDDEAIFNRAVAALMNASQ